VDGHIDGLFGPHVGSSTGQTAVYVTLMSPRTVQGDTVRFCAAILIFSSSMSFTVLSMSWLLCRWSPGLEMSFWLEMDETLGSWTSGGTHRSSSSCPWVARTWTAW
jgi:hypothetical protein